MRVLLLLGVLVSLFPFRRLVVMASITTRETLRFPPRPVPGTRLLENMRQAIHRIDFFGSLFNTVVVSVAGTVPVLFFDSLAAFAFAKYEFPARKPLFGILFATYMIPGRLSLVPSSSPCRLRLGRFAQGPRDTRAANTFGILWMRQYAQNSLPDELLDAGRIDGAGFFRLYWQVALANLDVAHDTDYAVVMAGVPMCVIPLIVVFLVGARHFPRDPRGGRHEDATRRRHPKA